VITLEDCTPGAHQPSPVEQAAADGATVVEVPSQAPECDLMQPPYDALRMPAPGSPRRLGGGIRRHHEYPGTSLWLHARVPTSTATRVGSAAALSVWSGRGGEPSCWSTTV